MSLKITDHANDPAEAGRERKQLWSDDFVVFMADALKEQRMTRKMLAAKTGLNMNYLYKILNGGKKTTERDYILAICIALLLDIEKTQHALKIYGMPALDGHDHRSLVIMDAVEHQRDIFTLNDSLERLGMVPLRVDREMKKASYQYKNGEDEEPLTQPEQETVDRAEDGLAAQTVSERYEIVHVETEADFVGPVAVDYSFCGVMMLKNEQGEIFYLNIQYCHPTVVMTAGDEFANVIAAYDEANFLRMSRIVESGTDTDEQLEAPVPIELFNSSDEIVGSRFYLYYLLLDQAIDDKIAETLSRVDDTRSYGSRIGTYLTGPHRVQYMEWFNQQQPGLCEYLQIIQTDDDYRFTVSHQSNYMRCALGEAYTYYFGDKPEPEFFVDTDDLLKLDGSEFRYRYLFTQMLTAMHEKQVSRTEAESGTDSISRIREKLNRFGMESCRLYQAGELLAAADMLENMLVLADRLETSGEDVTVTRVVTLWKLSQVRADMGDGAASRTYADRVLAMRDRIDGLKTSAPDGYPEAASALGDVLFDRALDAERDGSSEDALSLLRDAASYMEGNCSTQSDWVDLCTVYQKIAFLIDLNDPEGAVRLTGKAIGILRARQLEYVPDHFDLVGSVYNNHAWVLWNRLHSQEAVVYYGNLLDVAETMLNNDEADRTAVRARLEHSGKALYELYRSIGWNGEAKRLRQRLLDDGVKF